MRILICTTALALVVSGRTLPAEVVNGEQARELNNLLNRFAEDGFCGGVLVAKNGNVLLAKGYGFADRGQKRPFTCQTVFDIGSVTKQFTATGIVHLAMEKKLRLDDSISRFFPNCPVDKKPITLHHLLTHTAGMPDVFGDDYQVMTRQQLVDHALTARLLSPPGSRYRYSNAGYSLLAVVIELTSHEPYEKYLRRTLWLPAEMEQTGYRLPSWDRNKLAHGYTTSGQDWGTPLDHLWDNDGPYWNLKGNGGLLSTLEDLYRWNRAMKGERILPEAWKKKMYTPYVPEGPRTKSHYGYGWEIVPTIGGTRLITHNGGNGIFFDEVRNYIDEDLVVITASTSASNSIQSRTRALLKILFRRATTPGSPK